MIEERAAIEALVDAHYRAVFRLACALLGNRSAAEDVCQEVFLRAWERRSELTRHQSAHGWLLVTARNLAVSRLRRRSRWIRWLNTEKGTREPERGTCEAARSNDEVLQHVARLPEDLRVVLILRVVEEMKGQDVAECMGISQATVSRRLQQALEQLGHMMFREGEKESHGQLAIRASIP